jgi:uncharacterized membrane protein YeiB
MKSKLIKTLATTVALVFLLAPVPAIFSQTSSPSASPTPAMQMQEMNQMAGMQKMSESVTKMSEMCQMMMNKEMAGMHYKIAAGIILVVLLIIVLALLIVLEIQWIKYWSRILKQGKSTTG